MRIFQSAQNVRRYEVTSRRCAFATSDGFGAYVNGISATRQPAAYARTKLAAGWRLVAWVNAKDTGCLLAGLAAVADAAGLAHADPEPDAADLGRTIRRRLEADGERCLLVFDDVADPDVVRP